MNSSKKMDLLQTADGSPTIYSHRFDEIYHSRHGAIQESQHVFIKMGLHFQALKNERIRILEVGMGTGLNVFLTLLANDKLEKKIHYSAIEAFPLDSDIISNLNYPELLNAPDRTHLFERIHRIASEEEAHLSDLFDLTVYYKKLLDFYSKLKFDLIYFDAFAPKAQPEMWEERIFHHLFELISENGILVTYCAKGSVRRMMETIGFQVDRIEGPPGKREMIRAAKL